MKKYLILFLILLSNILFAYKLEIHNFQKMENGITSIIDRNGEYGMMIKLKTTIKELRFHSGLDPIKADLDVDGWNVFLSYTDDYIEVHSDDYGMVEYNIVKHRIQEQEVWECDLKIVPEIVELEINSEPQGNIFVDGKNYGVNRKIKVLEGRRSIKIQKDGYKTLMEEIEVKKEGKKYYEYLLNKEFVLNKVPTVIMSIPPDTEKILNNENMGSGETFSLNPSEYDLVLKKDGYETLSKKIKIDDKNFLFKDLILREDISRLILNINPKTAEINLESINLPYTKGNINKKLNYDEEIIIPSGKYKINIKNQDYLSQSKDIELKVNDKLELKVMDRL